MSLFWSHLMHNLCSPQFTKGLPDSSVKITPLPHHIFSTSDEKQTPLKPFLSHPFLPCIKLFTPAIWAYCSTEASGRHPSEETGCLKTRVLWNIYTTHSLMALSLCPNPATPSGKSLLWGSHITLSNVRPYKFCLHLTDLNLEGDPLFKLWSALGEKQPASLWTKGCLKGD